MMLLVKNNTTSVHISEWDVNFIDSFYLCQTYTHIPKHLFRDNANMIIMFKLNDLNMRHIYRDHVNTDISYDSSMKVCQKCWSDKYGFLIISKDKIWKRKDTGRVLMNL